MKTVVIVGAGFGGVRCALTLERLAYQNNLPLKIILIEKNNYHTFIPALYEVASASPRVSEHTLYNRANILIKDIVKNKNIEFIKGEVTKINEKKQYIALGNVHETNSQQKFANDANLHKIKFDYLILAVGSQINFNKVPGLKKYAIGLKTFTDALLIRRATKLADITPHKIVIGGGGASGVEAAAEIINCFKHFHRKDLRKKGKAPQIGRLTITIIDHHERLLSTFPKEVERIMKERLSKLNIKTLTGHYITKLTKTEVLLDNDKKIPYDLFIWAGGTQANPLLAELNVQKEERNLPKADSCLHLLDDQNNRIHNIFAIGDAVKSYNQNGERVPATAQKAIAEGDYVARDIINELQNKIDHKTCTPLKTKFIIPIGGKWAITQIYGIVFGNFFGWILKNLVALKYLSSILPKYKAIYKWIRAEITFSKND